MQTYGRKRGFLFGCLLGMIGGSVNLIAVCIYAEESTGSAFGLLCMGSAFLGFANGFVQFFRFAAAESWPERKGLAISITLLGFFLKLILLVMLNLHKCERWRYCCIDWT